MKAKQQLQNSHFANKGLFFIFECLLLIILLISFLIGLEKINLNQKYENVSYYFKAQDLYNVILSENITNIYDIETIIIKFIPNVDYEIKKDFFSLKKITNKKNCIRKNVFIYENFIKKELDIKICF